MICRAVLLDEAAHRSTVPLKIIAILAFLHCTHLYMLIDHSRSSEAGSTQADWVDALWAPERGFATL